MERFNVILTQTNADGKVSFLAEANSIGAADLNGLSNDVASFAKSTYDLMNVTLKSAGVKGISKQRIKMGHEMNFKIEYLGDDVNLNFYIANFGSFVRDNEVEKVANVIGSIAGYQEKFGALFAIKK